MTKEFLNLLPKNTRYTADNDVYGNLNGYICVLKSNHDGMEKARDIDRRANITLSEKLQTAIQLLEKYSIDIVEDISGLK